MCFTDLLDITKNTKDVKAVASFFPSISFEVVDEYDENREAWIKTLQDRFPLCSRDIITQVLDEERNLDKSVDILTDRYTPTEDHVHGDIPVLKDNFKDSKQARANSLSDRKARLRALAKAYCVIVTLTLGDIGSV